MGKKSLSRYGQRPTIDGREHANPIGVAKCWLILKVVSNVWVGSKNSFVLSKDSCVLFKVFEFMFFW